MCYKRKVTEIKKEKIKEKQQKKEMRNERKAKEIKKYKIKEKRKK